MIMELLVENFAIIENMNVKFSEGLNIITGETGTGKSIVIDAINLLLGSRADKSLIRYGKESALIEGSFQLPEKNKSGRISEILEKFGIKIESDNLLIVSREIHSNGRNISRVNGRIANLSVLKSVVPHLLDIQGQNENQKLLRKEEQLRILDMMIDNEFIELKGEIKEEAVKISNLRKRLSDLDIDDMKKEREIELLKYQINEIDSAELKEGEDEELIEKYRMLEKSDEIKRVLFKCTSALDGDGYSEGALSNLYSIGNELYSLSDADKKLGEFSETILSAYYSLQDINRDIILYGDSMDFSEEELFNISSRIDTINSLKRKYGNTVEEIDSYREKIERELRELENIDREIEELKKEISEAEKIIMEKSEILSKERRRVSSELKDKMEKELRELNMKDSEFEVRMKRKEKPNETGIDDIEFMISANIGQPLKPISKVASGGEISRIMLAFKNIINEKDDISTLIFDEIDTGISGRTAQLVGEKILRVSEKNQIICITHLPQIAAMADHHFLINKDIKDGVTTAEISELSREERIDELSRLTGGVSVTESTKKHAEDMIALSEKLKKK